MLDDNAITTNTDNYSSNSATMKFIDRHTALSGRKRIRASRLSFMMILSLAACSTTCWNNEYQVEAFGVRKWISSRVRIKKTGEPGRFLADDRKNTDDSWSKSARSSSPLQVRKRVKAVLEKARTRTGVDNGSVMPRNVVAEAASIGGFDDNVIIQLKKKNGSMNGQSRNGVGGGQIVFPDEELLIERTNGTESTTNGDASVSTSTSTTTTTTVALRKKKGNDFDVIRGDVPAAANTFISEPLPFKLPKLSVEQLRMLHSGERIQEQARMGREGSGYVVVDVKAPPYVVWESLLDFENYPEMISTVKEMQLYTSEKLNTGYVNEKPVLPGTGRETRHYGIPSVTRASFVLSKFRLNIAAVHTYTPHPDGDYMVFNLDRSCTNMVLKGAKGIWHIVANPEGREVRQKKSCLISGKKTLFDV